MYQDPQSVTIAGTPYSMPRVGSANPERIGTFANDDGSMTLTIRQDQSAQRFRREYRLTRKKLAVDPISAATKEASASIIVVVDEPKVGFSNSELIDTFSGVVSALTASSNAAVSKLLGGEL